MNSNKLISKIEQAVNNEFAAQARELKRLEAEIEKVEKTLKSKAKDIGELLQVLRYIHNCPSSRCKEFISTRYACDIHHNLGLDSLTLNDNKFDVLAKHGGGCLGDWDIYVYANGEISTIGTFPGCDYKTRLSNKLLWMKRIPAELDTLIADTEAFVESL